MTATMGNQTLTLTGLRFEASLGIPKHLLHYSQPQNYLHKLKYS